MGNHTEEAACKSCKGSLSSRHSGCAGLVYAALGPRCRTYGFQKYPISWNDMPGSTTNTSRPVLLRRHCYESHPPGFSLSPSPNCLRGGVGPHFSCLQGYYALLLQRLFPVFKGRYIYIYIHERCHDDRKLSPHSDHPPHGHILLPVLDP